MSAEAIIAAAVGVTVLLGALWRVLKAGHRWANAQERMAETVSTLADKVESLDGTLNNGLRADVARAVRLAADAARSRSLDRGRVHTVRLRKLTGDQRRPVN